MSPATPAADSVCPMLPFTEPIRSVSEPGGLAFAMTFEMLPASVESPTGVPVPCASMYWTFARSDSE